MFKLNKLFSEPEIFDPIEFTDGLNVILGEKVPGNPKTNGVGKSLSIEFINFALLKKKADSRLAQIPDEVLPPETLICLSFLLGKSSFTIKRSIANSDRPVLFENGRQVPFNDGETVLRYLTERMFAGSTDRHPSFRVMLGPLIRDERSEFKSIVSCYDTKRRIPDDYSPHLYLFGIDLDRYTQIKNDQSRLDSVKRDIKSVEDAVRTLTKSDLPDARAALNEMEKQAQDLTKAIDELRTAPGYDAIKDEIVELEENLAQKRRSRALLRQRLLKMRPISEPKEITPEEIAEFYDKLKRGLGALVARDLTEVYAFKDKVDSFQNSLLENARKSLDDQIGELNRQIEAADIKYSQKVAVLNYDGAFSSLKQALSAQRSTTETAVHLRGLLDRHAALDKERKTTRSAMREHIDSLAIAIEAQNATVSAFEETVLSIHERIQGNRHASFEIRETTKKQIVEIDMRISEDGSHSIDREKVFIYDFCLLTSPATTSRHPGLLIHDNIFDVDQDTLQRNLELLLQWSEDAPTQQYLLTINSDDIPAGLISTIRGRTCAAYTKETRFLRTVYQERN